MARRTQQEQREAREEDAMSALPVLDHLSFSLDAETTAEEDSIAKASARALNAAGFELIYRLNPNTGDMQAYAIPSLVGKAYSTFSRHVYHDSDGDE